jgi:hypothetical protein
VTVTSGSTVARIDAAVGPTFRSPAKKRLTAATVETTEMHASQPQPASVTWPGCSWPSSAEPVVSVTAAPVHTRAERTSGRMRPTTPSLTRM